MTPIKNIDTAIRCKQCNGERVFTRRRDTGGAIAVTEQCDRCDGTGVEPMPKADVDRGEIKP